MVDRYSPDFDEEDQGPSMQLDPAGDYVELEDYIALEDEIAELKNQKDDLLDKLREIQWHVRDVH